MLLTYFKKHLSALGIKGHLSVVDVYIRVLSYVESAPFERTLDAFFDYTDMLDKKKRGNGAKLYNEMMEAVQKIDSGETSPSAGSPAAESGSSA